MGKNLLFSFLKGVLAGISIAVGGFLYILMTFFVAGELGCDVPLHFSRAFPYYKMNDISPTRPEILYKAKEIALDNGIENVYLGNI